MATGQVKTPLEETLEELVSIDKISLDGDNMDKLTTYLAKSNLRLFNHSKLAEELFELGEVVTKIGNKAKERQPSVDKVIEEMGDVVFRVGIFLKTNDIDVNDFADRVENRIIEKANLCLNALKKDKYRQTV